MRRGRLFKDAVCSECKDARCDCEFQSQKETEIFQFLKKKYKVKMAFVSKLCEKYEK